MIGWCFWLKQWLYTIGQWHHLVCCTRIPFLRVVLSSSLKIYIPFFFHEFLLLGFICHFHGIFLAPRFQFRHSYSSLFASSVLHFMTFGRSHLTFNGGSARSYLRPLGLGLWHSPDHVKYGRCNSFWLFLSGYETILDRFKITPAPGFHKRSVTGEIEHVGGVSLHPK